MTDVVSRAVLDALVVGIVVAAWALWAPGSVSGALQAVALAVALTAIVVAVVRTLFAGDRPRR